MPRYNTRKYQQDVAAFFDAAETGNAAVIKEMLNKNVEVNIRNDQNRTALMEACLAGQAEAVEALLAAGADVNATDHKGLTALMEAARLERSTPKILDMINALIKSGAELELKSLSYERTAFYRAVAFGHIDIVKVLLDAGADVNTTADYKGMTPLMHAACNDRHEIVEMLLKAGAKIDAKNQYGRTAFDLAIKYNKPMAFCILKNFGKISFQERLDQCGDNINIPEDYKCPIQQTIVINDPVAASSGIAYDREGLARYFAAKKFPETVSCAITKKTIRKEELLNETNVFIKNKIEKFVEEQEELAKNEKIKQSEEKSKKRSHPEEPSEENSIKAKCAKYVYGLFSHLRNTDIFENKSEPTSSNRPT